MKVKIRAIVDHGQKEERIILDVINDTDIGKYLAVDTTYTKDGKISNKVRHPYWFPDQPVKAGDVVVLYTRKGTFSSTKNPSGSTSFFFFWGLDSNIWNNEGDYALLFYVDDWTSHKVTLTKK